MPTHGSGSLGSGSLDPAVLQATIASLRADRQRLSGSLAFHHQALSASNGQITDLKKKLADTEKKASNAALLLSANPNHVAIDGQSYDVLWRSTLQNLQTGSLDPNATVVVITKTGG
jgi:hypothetical protein